MQSRQLLPLFTKTSFLLVLLLGFFSLSLAGCEIGNGDSDASDTSPGVDVPSETETPDTDTTPSPNVYEFVLLEDLSVQSEPGEDAGADIDAVVGIKSNGDEYYAGDVAYFEFGFQGFAEQLDPTAALGAPDAVDYPLGEFCRADANFVSLGGTGGRMVVKMNQQIVSGDRIRVVEVGGCTIDRGSAEGQEAKLEEVRVSISVASDPDGTWTPLGTGTGPIFDFPVE